MHAVEIWSLFTVMDMKQHILVDTKKELHFQRQASVLSASVV